MKFLMFKNESIWSESPEWCKIQKKGAVRWISILLTIAVLNLTIGCRSYFKVNSSPEPSSQIITGVNDSGKTIIIHFNQNKWVLSDIQIRNNTVTGKATDYTMPPTLNPVRPDRPNRYISRVSHSQRYLLNEVHLYLNEFADLGNKLVSIPVSSISKIEIYDKDTASTVGSWFLGAVGVAAAAFALTAILMIIFKESCPFIYTWDGEKYQFAGEIYSGSIYKPLERNDYLRLPVYPDQRSYVLKITNEAREIQHTNLLELLVTDHPEKSEILIDKYGNLKTLSQQAAPTAATNLAGQNIIPLIASKDSQFYQSNSSGDKLPLKDGVILEFPAPGKAKTAKLAIRAKNSILLDFMMGKFHDLFGSAYKGFEKKQQKSSGATMRQWSLAQGIPLSVYVGRNGSWEFVDYYNIAGPMKYKDDVISIPLTGSETDPLKVKLEFGNLLWEIDYAAIDYSPDEKVTTYTIPVKTAFTELQKNVADLLAKDDLKYYDQPIMDNYATVTFDLPVFTGQNRTVILHSKGWYEILRNPDGKPEIANLKTFRQSGRFNQFVNENIKKMEQSVSQPQ